MRGFGMSSKKVVLKNAVLVIFGMHDARNPHVPLCGLRFLRSGRQRSRFFEAAFKWLWPVSPDGNNPNIKCNATSGNLTI
jgi:hypothetical protein